MEQFVVTTLSGDTKTIPYNNNGDTGTLTQGLINNATQSHQSQFYKDTDGKIKKTPDNRRVFGDYLTAAEVYKKGKETFNANDYYVKNLVRKNRFIFLFGESGTGKSLFARQLAQSIGTGKDFFEVTSITDGSQELEKYRLENQIKKPHKVIYYDLELSPEQLYGRYSDNGKTTPFKFSDNIITRFPEFESAQYFEAFENDMKENKADVYIIDNLAVISGELESSTAAKELMIAFKRLMRKYGSTVIVLTHTPKRKKYEPIGTNDMVGSAQYTNLADDCFSIARTTDGAYYIKQQKTRSNSEYFNENNVLIMNLTQDRLTGFLGFEFAGYDTESNVLRTFEAVEFDKAIKRLLYVWNNNGGKDGKGGVVLNAYSQIAHKLESDFADGLSFDSFKKKVTRRAKKLLDDMSIEEKEELKSKVLQIEPIKHVD